MRKQDLNGVRTPLDVERRHKLGAIPELEGDVKEIKTEMILDTSLSASSEHGVQNKVITQAVNALNLGKVDKESGKGLSTNDFTDTDKASIHTHDNKSTLDGITQQKVNQWDSNTFNIDMVHPVGSIYISVNNTNPSTLFPGTTWEQIKDKFMLSAGDTYNNGATGGSATHKLTSAELPTHTHTYDKVKSPTGGPSTNTSGSTVLTIDQIPSHNHNTKSDAGSGSTWVPNYTGNRKAGGSGVYTENTGGGQGHTHTLSNHTHTTSTSSTNTGNGGFANNSFSTMPPYLVVYMWKRIS
jgi:microcystin-dependent protein